MRLANLPVYTVSQVNGYVKGLMDGDELLTGLLVRGRSPIINATPRGTTTFR